MQKDTKMRDLPDELYNLCQLEVLILDGNPIDAIPENLGQLKSLKRLNLNRNSHLQALPESLTTLAALKELDIIDDNFTAAPEKTEKIIAALRARGCLIKDS